MLRAIPRRVLPLIVPLLPAAAVAVPVHDWSLSFGGLSQEQGQAVAVDATGAVLVTGWFLDVVDFGGGPLSAGVWGDIFLAKYDVTGAHLWSRSFGTLNYLCEGYDLDVDIAGNVYLSGETMGNIDLGGGVLAGTMDEAFVASYRSDGGYRWGHVFNGVGYSDVETAYCVAVDPSGNVFVGGSFDGAVDLGGGVHTTSGGEDMFLLKLDATGAFLWSRQFGSLGSSQFGSRSHDRIRDLAVDDSGNVFLTGYFGAPENDRVRETTVDDFARVAFTGGLTDTVDFGGGPLISAGGGDVFLVKLDGSGNHLWSRRFGGTADDAGRSVALDASGNAVITGTFAGTADFGGGAISSNASSDDIFVAKFDAAVGHLWSHGFGGSQADHGWDVDVGSGGEVAATGDIQGTVDFGGGPINAGRTDVFLLKLDPGGGHVWSAGFGGTGTVPDEHGRSVATDPTGAIVATGWFTGVSTGNTTVDFGGGPLPHVRSSDIFLVRFEAGAVPAPVTQQPAPPAALGQNAPNPFTGRTVISCTLERPAHVIVGIHDATGALVARLDRGVLGPGGHRVEWDGRDARGRPVPSGVYFYRLEGVARSGRAMTVVR